MHLQYRLPLDQQAQRAASDLCSVYRFILDFSNVSCLFLAGWQGSVLNDMSNHLITG
jgi:hypothetical protein